MLGATGAPMGLMDRHKQGAYSMEYTSSLLLDESNLSKLNFCLKNLDQKSLDNLVSGD